MRAGDASCLGVLAHHVVRLPARDVHEIVRRPAGLQPLVCERAAEAMRMNVLYPGLLFFARRYCSAPDLFGVRSAQQSDSSIRGEVRTTFWSVLRTMGTSPTSISLILSLAAGRRAVLYARFAILTVLRRAPLARKGSAAVLVSAILNGNAFYH